MQELIYHVDLLLTAYDDALYKSISSPAAVDTFRARAEAVMVNYKVLEPTCKS